MKTIIQFKIIAVIFLFATSHSVAQKKVQQFLVSKEFNFSAEQLWAVVAEDYGAVANSHPRIIRSDYIGGTLTGTVGAKRVCYFNQKETKYLKERISVFDPEHMTFTNQVYHTGGFPLDPEYSLAIYTIEDLGKGHSKFTFNMQYRTKPAFMGGIMKGSFKKLIQDYFIALEHFLETGEVVTKENFKNIKKQYNS